MFKRSLKTAFLSFLLLGITATGFTQNQQTRPEQDSETIAKNQTSQMKKSLTLDAAQEKKVYDLNLDHAKKRVELRKARETNPQGNMKEQMSALRTEYDKNLKSILTEEQYKKYVAGKENSQKKPANGPAGQKEKPAGAKQGGEKK